MAEIQVKTILQHAWAEIEHDIQYKSIETAPTSIKRRFMALAGLLEIADREFQAIQDEDEMIREKARESVQKGELESVEITPDALKAYLDKRLGSDNRMKEWSYEWTARLLRQLGFTNFYQLEECINGYDDDMISRILKKGRKGQLTRFEFLLLAGMGENFITNHIWAKEDWWVSSQLKKLKDLKDANVSVGEYSPS